MSVTLMLTGVVLFPVAGLGLLLWLTHLEETLPRDVRTALQRAVPPPILAVPARQADAPPATVATTGPTTGPTTRPAIPQQRSAPAAEAQARPAG